MPPRIRLTRVLVTLPLALGGIALAASPAAAAPALTTITPDPVAPDGVLTIQGTGCSSGDLVSFRFFDTSGGGGAMNVDGATSAGGAGQFAYDYPLANRWDAGDEIGVKVACAATYTDTDSSGPAYFAVQLDDAFVEILAPARVPYGLPHDLAMRFNEVPGNAELVLDGSQTLEFLAGEGDDASYVGYYRYRLPAELTVGDHTLTATFDPAVDGAPTVVDTVTLTVTKATPTVVLKAKKKVRAGKKLRATVSVTLDGIASRAGKVIIKDGKRKVAKLDVPASGATKTKLRLTDVGRHQLRAVFKGNAETAKVTSAAVKVRVRR